MPMNLYTRFSSFEGQQINESASRLLPKGAKEKGAEISALAAALEQFAATVTQGGAQVAQQFPFTMGVRVVRGRKETTLTLTLDMHNPGGPGFHAQFQGLMEDAAVAGKLQAVAKAAGYDVLHVVVEQRSEDFPAATKADKRLSDFIGFLRTAAVAPAPEAESEEAKKRAKDFPTQHHIAQRAAGYFSGVKPSFEAFSQYMNEAVEGDGKGGTLTMFYDGKEMGELTLNAELKSEEGKNNEGLTTRSVVHIGSLATTGTSVHNMYIASDDKGELMRNTSDRQGNTYLMSKVSFSAEDAQKFAALLQKVLRMRAVTTFAGQGFKTMSADQLTSKTTQQ